MYRKSNKHLIYLITDGNYLKIGRTTKLTTFRRRLRGIQTSNPNKLATYCLIPSTYKVTETSIHEKFKDLRVHGEWFKKDKRILDYFMNRWVVSYDKGSLNCSSYFHSIPTYKINMLTIKYRPSYLERLSRIKRAKKDFKKHIK